MSNSLKRNLDSDPDDSEPKRPPPVESDIDKGQEILRAGQRLGPAELGLPSTSGITVLKSTAKPLVGVKSTENKAETPKMVAHIPLSVSSEEQNPANQQSRAALIAERNQPARRPFLPGHSISFTQVSSSACEVCRNACEKSRDLFQRHPACWVGRELHVTQLCSLSGVASLQCPLSQLYGIDCLQDLSAYPALWGNTDDRVYQEKGFMSGKVAKSSTEYHMVMSYIRCIDSSPVVRKITRIQNKPVWTVFSVKRHQLVRTLGESQLSERWMLHGSIRYNQNRICAYGLDCHKDTETKTKNRFGNGIHVSTGEFFDSNFDRTTTLFLCRVLTGVSTLGEAGYINPPYDHSNHRFYNSCVDRLSNPTVHVIFDNDQIHPAYLVELKD